MSYGRRWTVSLWTLLILGQAGCAVRGGGPSDPDRPRLELHTAEPVSVVSGSAPVRVRRAALVEAWKEDTGQCVKDIAPLVMIQTFGVGLVVTPVVCGVMTPVLPPPETHRRRVHDRESIEAALAADSPSTKLRDQILVAGGNSRLHLEPLVATGPGVWDAPVDARISGRPPEVMLEVTVTEIGVRDDLTLARVAARIRALRSSDGSELGTSTFVQEPPVRQNWQAGLDEALTELAKAITGSLAWSPDADASRNAESAGASRLLHQTGAPDDDDADAERLAEAR